MNKDHYGQILEQVVDGFWSWDVTRDEAFLNPRYCELLGYSPDEAHFNSSIFLKLIHPDDAAAMTAILQEYFEGKRNASLAEFRMIKNDGSVIWVRERASVVDRDSSGKPRRLVGSVINITDYKLAELELRASHELLRNLTRQLPGALFQTLLTADGKFSTPYASNGVFDLYGIAPDEITEDISPIMERFHPDDRDAIMASIMESAKTLRMWEHEYRILLPDKSLKWLRGQALPMAQSDGSTIWHGFITDITERKVMEMSLKESEERYRRLFEVESDAIFLVSCLSGRFVDANQAALKTYGYSKEELLDMVFTDVSAEPDRTNANLENNVTHVPLRWHRRKDGSIFPVEISGSYFDALGDTIHVAAIRDVSERIKAEQFREETLEQLEQQVEERTASLTSANEKLSLEIEERKQTEAELLDYQRRLEELGLEISITEEQVRCRIASELHDQVGQCLMLSKIKVDSLADSDLSPEQLTTVKTLERLLEKTIHDIRSLTFQLRPPILVQAGLEAAVRWLADEFKEQHGLLVEFIDDRQPKPLTDELRAYLFQAVRELLLNVAKHAGTNRACVIMQKAHDTLTISVEDNGTGFDPAAAIMRRPRSGGFGLFNVQQRTQYFGGIFTIESSPGCGCTATIVAPLAAEASPMAGP